MDATEVVRRYVEAWNRHDAPAIVSSFRNGGTYQDPASGRLSGDAIGQYAAELFAAFPDLSFDIVSLAPAGRHIALQWLMRGTNTEPFDGLPATGKSVALPGADFIEADADGIGSVTGYFDQKQFAEQLGLQAVVQPLSLGAVRFGTCVYLNGGGARKPGAFSLTSIHLRSQAEVDEVEELASAVLEGLASTPGFISSVLTTVGRLGHTITAWEDAGAPRQVLASGAHREAMSRFFGSDLAAGGVTSTWIPARINASWIRCPACNRMLDYDGHAAHGACSCGAALPERLPYW